MSKIGIIDDNRDQRVTLKLALESYLEKIESKFQVIDIFPFKTKDSEEYFAWIKDEDIVCLIFDERMHNETEDGIGPVGYRGSELVTEIRSRLKELPIYVITSNKIDDELTEKFSEFEDIIERQEFIDEGEKYVYRIVRATQRYLNEFENELEEFQFLSELIASGHYSEDQLTRLKALQVNLHLPLDSNLGERKDWLDEYEKNIIELEHLRAELESKLK